MATSAPKEQATLPTTQVPDWEVPAAAAANGPAKASIFTRITDKFNSIVPPHRTYFGRSRRTFLLVVGGIIFLILGLIIGLSVGLTIGRRNSAQNLPLPTDTSSHIGDLTYYSPGLGACGVTSSDDDTIVSVSHYLWDAVQSGSDPNSNPLCGQKLRARRYNEDVSAERSVDLTVVDRCVGCEATDIDLSPGAFDKLAPRESGRVTVTWAWLQPVATGAE